MHTDQTVSCQTGMQPSVVQGGRDPGYGVCLDDAQVAPTKHSKNFILTTIVWLSRVRKVWLWPCSWRGLLHRLPRPGVSSFF